MDAVKLVRSGWSTRKVAEHLGYSQSVIVQWMKRSPWNWRLRTIPTRSSRPHSHPKVLSQKLVDAVVAKREEHDRYAVVVHREPKAAGVVVSLSSVKCTLRRKGLIRERSPWKRWHSTIPRPVAEKPCELVQIDKIHIHFRGSKPIFYVFTLIDLFSRFAYAKVVWHINTHESLRFVQEAEQAAGFSFSTV